MPMLRVRSLMMMAVLLLSLSSCATAIKDEQFCSPLPGNLGATCDNFLTSNQLILTEDQWQALMAQWIADGNAVECTTSETVGDIKGEIEKLCSGVPWPYTCDYATKSVIINGLTKVMNLRHHPM